MKKVISVDKNAQKELREFSEELVLDIGEKAKIYMKNDSSFTWPSLIHFLSGVNLALCFPIGKQFAGERISNER